MDRSGEPTYVALSNSWIIIINVGGGDRRQAGPVTLETPRDPDRLSSLLNIRVRDIVAVYAERRACGAHFLTPPKHHQYEIRCYIRDPDGCIVEAGRPPTWTATGRPISGSPPAYSGAAACAGTLVGAYLSAATTARHVAGAVELAPT